MMDLIKAITTRRSIRAYKETIVQKSDIETLLDAAVQAPSAANSQPWSFSVITEGKLMDKISQDAKAYILSVMDEMSFLEGYRPVLSNLDYNIFYNAPALITIYSATNSTVALSDCALAAENLMLTAHSMGLGTCWIGFAQMYLNTAEAKQLFAVPENLTVAAAITLGYPASSPPQITKKPPIVHFYK